MFKATIGGFSPFILVILSLALSACRPPQTPQLTTPTPSPSPATPTPTLPPPQVQITRLPDARSAATAYLEAWQKENFASMYAMLDSASQSAQTLADFRGHYRDIAVEAALSGIDYQLLEVNNSGSQARADYQVVLHSNLVGDVQDQTSMNLVLEGGQWRVRWEDTLVLSHLSGDNYLKMERSGYLEPRANIYDRFGQPLAAPSEATAVGLFTDQIDWERAEELYTRLTRLTGVPSKNLERLVDEAFALGAYLPLGEYSRDWVSRVGISSLPGVQFADFSGRFYYQGGLAPHVIGYVAPIQSEEQLDGIRRKGYLKDELIGQRGLELWGESYLIGERGGALQVRNGQDVPVTLLAERPSTPPQVITTTLEAELQLAAQRSLQGFNGAIVVLERDTGRVLAMASSPGFNPNAFNPQNYNGYVERSELSNPSLPLFNRAAEGQYPLGSVFKIITLAAALEKGGYTPDMTYECNYEFTEVPGLVRYDWTWEHFQEDEETRPSGLLTVPQALIRSCNPFFWHVGYDLYNRGLTTAISDMARGFGLGQPTGLEGIPEVAGQAPEPTDPVDAINLAIGQGNLQVTPLQVASFAAAVGNGGTLYRPQVIESIGVEGTTPTLSFSPQSRGTLPVSAENLQIIQEAMRGVTASRTPRGTAYHVFNGLRIPVSGKTGTATSGFEPHAWFAGYTTAGRPNRADIAIAVVVENIGEGSDFAAPIFRRMVEMYFFGSPGRLFPWEESYWVHEEPEDETATETPTPTPEGGEEGEATPEPGEEVEGEATPEATPEPGSGG